jgi:hypothetical protein
MKVRGINYDAGMYFTRDHLSRNLSQEQIKREMATIKNDLNANAVRIYGMEKDSIHQVSEIALDKGIHVWYSPHHINLSKKEALKKIAEYAKDADRLRQENPNVVFVLGNEFTLEVKGFYDGKNWVERAKHLGNYNHHEASIKLKPFLKQAIAIARKNFSGKITYAAGFWEDIDWKAFDFVSVNKYLFGWNKKTYKKELQDLKKYGKPVVITEFGCGSFKGASDMDAPSSTIVNWTKGIIEEDYERDEGEQAKHIGYLLKMFEKEGVYGTFPYTFVELSYPHKENPHEDLDMASYNIIKVLKNGIYKQKESFKTISKFYRSH